MSNTTFLKKQDAVDSILRIYDLTNKNDVFKQFSDLDHVIPTAYSKDFSNYYISLSRKKKVTEKGNNYTINDDVYSIIADVRLSFNDQLEHDIMNTYFRIGRIFDYIMSFDDFYVSAGISIVIDKNNYESMSDVLDYLDDFILHQSNNDIKTLLKVILIFGIMLRDEEEALAIIKEDNSLTIIEWEKCYDKIAETYSQHTINLWGFFLYNSNSIGFKTANLIHLHDNAINVGTQVKKDLDKIFDNPQFYNLMKNTDKYVVSSLMKNTLLNNSCHDVDKVNKILTLMWFNTHNIIVYTHTSPHVYLYDEEMLNFLCKPEIYALIDALKSNKNTLLESLFSYLLPHANDYFSLNIDKSELDGIINNINRIKENIPQELKEKTNILEELNLYSIQIINKRNHINKIPQLWDIIQNYVHKEIFNNRAIKRYDIIYRYNVSQLYHDIINEDEKTFNQLVTQNLHLALYCNVKNINVIAQ